MIFNQDASRVQFFPFDAVQAEEILRYIYIVYILATAMADFQAAILIVFTNAAS